MTYKAPRWHAMAIIAEKGNQSKLGCIIIAMLGYMPKHAPRLRGLAVILPDGTLTADMDLGNGRGFLATPLGPVAEIRDDLRRLADRLKLEDAERVDLFDQFRKWVVRDLRAKSELH